MKKLLTFIFILSIVTPLLSKDSKELEEILKSIISAKTYRNEKAILKKKKPEQINKSKKKISKEKKVTFPTKDEALLKTCIQLFEASLFKSSIKKIEELKSQYPDSQHKCLATIWLSKIYIKLNKFDKAIEALKTIEQESGEYPSALFITAAINQRNGNKPVAIEYYNKVASLFPDHELADDSLISISRLYLFENKGNMALEAAIRVIKQYKDRETRDDAWFILARIFEKDSLLKDPSIARKIYKIFLKKANKVNSVIFKNSPLIHRVKKNLKFIESTYYKFEI